ncbi:hypothetical protein ACOMHN_059776 [Nucella lapillus]
MEPPPMRAPTEPLGDNNGRGRVNRKTSEQNAQDRSNGDYYNQYLYGRSALNRECTIFVANIRTNDSDSNSDDNNPHSQTDGSQKLEDLLGSLARLSTAEEYK